MFILIIIFTFIILLFYILNQRIENFDNNIKINIGNHLCYEFTQCAIKFLNNKDYTPRKSNEFWIKDFPIIKFDQNIKDQLLKEGITIEYINSLYDIFGNWSIENKKKEKFWDIMYNIVNNTLNEMFIKNGLKKNIEYPVIHFRCSDVPFVKHFSYHLQKYSYLKDCLDEAKIKLNKKFDKVILVSCSFHLAENKNQEKCNIYIESMKEYLESIGYEVIVQCQSNIDDFATIFYAPVIISPGSSFSFMSGYFGGGLFFSEGHYIEGKEDLTKCKDCKEWLKSGYSIPHSEITDYYDTDSVISKLKK